MRPVEFFRFYVVPLGGKKPSLTSYRMTLADAQARFPGCKPEPSSREVRMLPEPGEKVKMHRAGRDGIGGS
jgi:hypothetical protein